MDTNNRQLLKKQLEQQAKQFVTEQDETELAISILSTCSALLRAAEKTMPKSFSHEEFDMVFAGYLGVANRVNGFYKNHTVDMNEEESELLKQIRAALNNAEKEKKTLDNKLVKEKNRSKQIEAEVKKVKKEVTAEQKKQDNLEKEKAEKEQNLRNIRNRVTELENELHAIHLKTEELEPDMDMLITSVNTAKDTYEEMIAYYSELQKIQEGIQEEGFVDIKSFTEKLQTMNDSGKAIMTQYDSMLKNLTADMESLQAKIEARRKAGAVI
jgi:chromosome segregation ATPase